MTTNKLNSDLRQTGIIRKAIEGLNPSPPKHLSPNEKTLFKQTVNEFSREEMTDFKLTLITLLVQALSHAQEEQLALAEEGHVITTNEGNRVANPRLNVMKSYLSTVLALRKTLGMTDLGHSRAAEGAKRSLTKALEERTLETVEADKDQLLRTSFN